MDVLGPRSDRRTPQTLVSPLAAKGGCSCQRVLRTRHSTNSSSTLSGMRPCRPARPRNSRIAVLPCRTIVDCKIVHVHPDKSICSFLIQTTRQGHRMFDSRFSVLQSVVDALF